MKTLITQVGMYVTGDAVADAVLQYWRALNDESRADIVEIPTVASDGSRSRLRLTLGATLPLAVVDADPAQGFDDDGAADLVLAQMRSLTFSAAAPFSPGELPDIPDMLGNSFL
jgi:hypothetical protein